MLKVPGDDLVELPENEYYFHQIVGCEVYTDENTDKPLGTITDILQPGANDVWVVKPAKGQEILIPVINDVVLSVDIAAKKITVHLMEGLLP
ncbi:Ribosome maturation factor RimM [compost metagenome]